MPTPLSERHEASAVSTQAAHLLVAHDSTAPVEEYDRSAMLPLIMRHQNNGCVQLRVELVKKRKNLFTGLRIQVSCRFIGQKYRRIEDQCACDGDTLTLTT